MKLIKKFKSWVEKTNNKLKEIMSKDSVINDTENKPMRYYAPKEPPAPAKKPPTPYNIPFPYSTLERDEWSEKSVKEMQIKKWFHSISNALHGDEKNDFISAFFYFENKPEYVAFDAESDEDKIAAEKGWDMLFNSEQEKSNRSYYFLKSEYKRLFPNNRTISDVDHRPVNIDFLRHIRGSVTQLSKDLLEYANKPGINISYKEDLLSNLQGIIDKFSEDNINKAEQYEKLRKEIYRESVLRPEIAHITLHDFNEGCDNDNIDINEKKENNDE